MRERNATNEKRRRTHATKLLIMILCVNIQLLRVVLKPTTEKKVACVHLQCWNMFALTIVRKMCLKCAKVVACESVCIMIGAQKMQDVAELVAYMKTDLQAAISMLFQEVELNNHRRQSYANRS